jgi:hypothetical protein
MRPPRRAVFAVSLSVLALEEGCAARVAPLLSESTRASLGEVAVVSVEAPPDREFARPVPSAAGASAVGVGAGLGVGVLGGAACFATFGYFVPACAVALWTPVMMVTGGVEGAKKGVSLAELREASEALEQTASEAYVQEALRDELVRTISKYDVERVVTARIGSGPPTLTGGADYRALTEEGVTSVIEVAVLSLDLVRASIPGKQPGYGPSFSVQRLIDPPLRVRVHARVRLMHAADGTALYAHTFVHESQIDTFLGWGRDNARAFRDARQSAVEALAREIADALIGWRPHG